MRSTETIQAGSLDVRRLARSRLLCTARIVVAIWRLTPIDRQRGGGSDSCVDDVRNHACTEAPHGQLAVRAAQ